MAYSSFTDTHGPVLLVVGHGTGDAQGQAEYQALMRRVVRLLPDVIVEGCFLELVEPSLPAALHDLERRGARQVIAVPLLLFEAGHAKRDIPFQAQQAVERGRLRVHVTPALKSHPRLLELSARRWYETVGTLGSSPDEHIWLFVGRGNRDAEATAGFHEFLARRRELTPVGEARGAFLAMAPPRVEAVMDELRNHPRKWVIVQPHLLFAGALLNRLADLVRARDRPGQRQRWLLTRHLGSDEYLAEAVADRFREAATSLATGLPVG